MLGLQNLFGLQKQSTMNTIQKWEYMEKVVDNRFPDISFLDALGKQGWELVSIMHGHGWATTLYLKRPIMPETEIKKASDPEVITPNKKTSKHFYWAYLYLAVCILSFINSVIYFFNSNYPAMCGCLMVSFLFATIVFDRTNKNSKE